MDRIVEPQALTRSAFRPFGTVIEAGRSHQPISINSGTCKKYAQLAVPDCAADGGHGAVHLYRVRALPLPIIVKSFERHVRGSQTFVPLSGRPYLVVVAPPVDFSLEAIQVFRAQGNQGVQYARGTWHHFCLALENESDFLVIDRVAAEPDCQVIDLPPEHHLTIRL